MPPMEAHDAWFWFERAWANPYVRWLWWLPLLALLWWLTRRLAYDEHEAHEPDWKGRRLWFRLERLDWVSLGILAGIGAFLWIGRNSIYPVPPDSIYHLLVARQIAETGTIPLWNDWQYAPVGRPHLYPPLFHLLLVGAAGICGGDFLAGFRLIETLGLPFIFFTTWYLARWLYDARRAFAALLLAGMDYSLVFTAAMGTPSVLATSFASLLVVFFLSGRVLMASLLGAVMAYTHMGMPPIALAGLGLFTLRHRRYLYPYLFILCSTVLVASPWYARIWVFRDYFVHPLETDAYGSLPTQWLPLFKITWLQLVSVIMLVLIVRSVRGLRLHETRTHMVAALLLASLPMLTGYGGRFYTHTLHLWCVWAGGLFSRYLSPPVSGRRIALFLLLALCPTIALIGTGTPLKHGAYPAPSAWILPPLVATGGLKILNGLNPPGYVSWDEAQLVAARVEELTGPDDIVYFEWDRDLALMIAWLAHRKTDTGAWEETQPKPGARALIEWTARNDSRAVYVSRSTLGLPEDTTIERVGDLYIAFRREAGPEQHTDAQIR
ncbi:MAG: hypothetical protein AMXMBFR4_32160 [Candidatus Hydrogenedentota bacterium]